MQCHYGSRNAFILHVVANRISGKDLHNSNITYTLINSSTRRSSACCTTSVLHMLLPPLWFGCFQIVATYIQPQYDRQRRCTCMTTLHTPYVEPKDGRTYFLFCFNLQRTNSSSDDRNMLYDRKPIKDRLETLLQESYQRTNVNRTARLQKQPAYSKWNPASGDVHMCERRIENSTRKFYENVQPFSLFKQCIRRTGTRIRRGAERLYKDN